MTKPSRPIVGSELDLQFPAGKRHLSGLWRDAVGARAVCVVAHGAGNDMRNDLLDGITLGLSRNEVSAMRFNFPFTEEGRRGPDRPPDVSRLDLSGGIWIEARQATMQSLGSQHSRFGLQESPDTPGRTRELQPVDHRPVVVFEEGC